jgi:hypothetical protein
VFAEIVYPYCETSLDAPRTRAVGTAVGCFRQACAGRVDHLILLAPSANRVYASEANRLVTAELKIMLGANDQPATEQITLAGIGYLALATENLDERGCQALGRLSGCYATFCRQHDRLQPIEVKKPDLSTMIL